MCLGIVFHVYFPEKLKLDLNKSILVNGSEIVPVLDLLTLEMFIFKRESMYSGAILFNTLYISKDLLYRNCWFIDNIFSFLNLLFVGT